MYETPGVHKMAEWGGGEKKSLAGINKNKTKPARGVSMFASKYFTPLYIQPILEIKCHFGMLGTAASH